MGSIPAGGARKSLIFKGFFFFSSSFVVPYRQSLPESNSCFVFSKTAYFTIFSANKISRIFALFTPLLIALLISTSGFLHSLANRERRTTQVQSLYYKNNTIKNQGVLLFHFT
ncbi:MAG: hypothetical protein IJK40_04415, partial [Clostridia bacterium]|nr:hypothetical protein [Clostridia bacterium]